MYRLIGMFDQIAVLAVGDFRVNAINALDIVYRDATAILMPIIGVTIFAGIAANYVQVGFDLRPRSLDAQSGEDKPRCGLQAHLLHEADRRDTEIDPQDRLSSVLLYFVIRDAIGAYVSSLACGMSCLINITSQVLFQTLIYSALAFIIVALADFAYQKHSYTKGLMMTKEEIKREYKESEGDPHIKGHRRQRLAQELAMGDGGHAARKGTRSSVNPTHLAVVLDYRVGKMPSAVTAKGRNLRALPPNPGRAGGRAGLPQHRPRARALR